jgi:hypothetical protein
VRSADEVANRFEKLLLRERLTEKREAAAGREVAVGSRHQEHGEVGFELAQALGDRVAADTRHEDVEHRHVDVVVLETGDRCETGRGSDDVITGLLERRPQELGKPPVVVCDENRTHALSVSGNGLEQPEPDNTDIPDAWQNCTKV